VLSGRPRYKGDVSSTSCLRLNLSRPRNLRGRLVVGSLLAPAPLSAGMEWLSMRPGVSRGRGSQKGKGISLFLPYWDWRNLAARHLYSSRALRNAYVADCKSHYPLRISGMALTFRGTRRPLGLSGHQPSTKNSGPNLSVLCISSAVLSNRGSRRDVIVIMRIRVVGDVDWSRSSEMSGGRSAHSGQLGRDRFVLLRDLGKRGG
jgi:hypothetical protein